MRQITFLVSDSLFQEILEIGKRFPTRSGTINALINLGVKKFKEETQ